MNLRGDWSIGDQVLELGAANEPGIWTVRVKSEAPSQKDLGSVQFALYPQEVEARKNIVDATGLQRAGLSQVGALKDSAQIQRDLQDLVDSITRQAWTISDVCSEASLEADCSGVSRCSSTSWSSLSPDPKSEFPAIQEDGRIR